MTAFWILAAIAASAAGLWIARPFLRRGTAALNDSESAISVFRDQLDEIERDAAAGLISAGERDEARREIERRTLQAARHLDGGFSISRRSLPAAAGLAVMAGLLALGGYWLTGMPQAPDQPLAARRTEILERRAAAGDPASRIALMIDRTRTNPDSFEDWWTLAVSQAAVENYDAAVEAYRRAAELGGARPGVMSAYAEAMVLANGNKVPGAARVIFEQVLSRGPDVRARYYIALAKAQAKDFAAALEDWAALARDSDPDAPWMPLVRRDMVNMARFLKRDLAEYLPDATPEEIARAGGAPDAQAAGAGAGRIAALRAALAEDPHDYKASIELARLLARQGEDKAAAAVLRQARDSYAAAPFVLGRIADAARALGLDMIASGTLDSTAPAGVSGPGADDIAAAAEMTPAEQDEMVAGMVAGLAAKLEERPDNPDGWIMLVRSYAVLGQTGKARDALDRANAHYAGNDAVLARLRAEAGAAIGRN